MEIFTILSLHLEREPLRMAFRALHHEDAHHRGTAPLRARPANEILAELVAAGGATHEAHHSAR